MWEFILFWCRNVLANSQFFCAYSQEMYDEGTWDFCFLGLKNTSFAKKINSLLLLSKQRKQPLFLSNGSMFENSYISLFFTVQWLKIFTREGSQCLQWMRYTLFSHQKRSTAFSFGVIFVQFLMFLINMFPFFFFLLRVCVCVFYVNLNDFQS